MNKSKIVVACSTLALGMAAVAGARIQTQIVVPVNQDKAAQMPVPTVIIEQVANVPSKQVATAKPKGRLAKKATKAAAKTLVKTVERDVPVVATVASRQVNVPLLRDIPVVAQVNTRPVQIAPSAPGPIAAPIKVVAPKTIAPLSSPMPAQAPARATTTIAAPRPVQGFYGVATTAPSPAYIGQGRSTKAVQGLYGTATAVPSAPQSKSNSAKRDDLDTYRNMRGEDRPDFLTHPMKFGTPAKPAQTRRSYSIDYRLSPQSQLKLSTGYLRSLSTAYEVKAANLKLKTTLGEGKVSRLFEERIVVKPDLDKTIVYQLKYNPETKKWEVVPLDKPGK